MTREDIIRMAREAGWSEIGADLWGATNDGAMSIYALERFAALVAAAQREKLAHWMRSMGYATHGDTMEEMLDHLGTQIAEGLEAEVLMEREACAKVCEDASKPREGEMHSDALWAGLVHLTATIRARSKT
jgi:hypothetical protein